MLPIYLCGEKIGTLQRTGRGISACCPINEGYIYRLELIGEQCMPLGVMMPRGDIFILEKRGEFDLSKWQYAEILRSLPNEAAALPLPFAISHGVPVMQCDFVKDDLLRQCLTRQGSAYTAVYRGKRYVYFPFDGTKDSPMSAFFFCLTVFDIRNRLYAAFCIDENNIPVSLF